MPLNYPDILQHNNDVYPIVDSNNILGSVFVTGSDGEQYGISEYKRKLGMIVYFSSSQDYQYYKGNSTSSADWSSPLSWSMFGGGGTFESYNFTASFSNVTSVDINHNLGFKHVILQVFDTDGNQIIPSEINLVNENQATITFSEQASGVAVATLGGATFSNLQVPEGPVYSVQYNDGGGNWGGSSKFQFNGTSLLLLNNNESTYALETVTSPYYISSNIFFNRIIQQATITGYINDKKYSGDILTPETSAAASIYDLVSLGGNGSGTNWETINQTDTSATRMLGILYTEGILTEGYIIVGSARTSEVPVIDGSLTRGAPVYIKEAATSAPFLTTTSPSSGYVRILGHIIYTIGDYWLMRFRPDNYWGFM